MNIHVKNKAIVDQLFEASVVKIEVGSTLYELNDAESDCDIFCIYIPFKNQQNSFVYTHHQLQFKDEENNVDYLFVDLYNFIRNTLSGDSTINFELLHTNALKNSDLSFLYDMRLSFYNYQIIKAYLGFAKRDGKQFNQSMTDRDQVKKLMHIERGLLFAENIKNNSFQLVIDSLIENKQQYKEWSFESRKEKINLLLEKIDVFRKYLNETNKFHLPFYMNIEAQIKLDEALLKFSGSTLFKSKQKSYFNLNMFYETNENGLVY